VDLPYGEERWSWVDGGGDFPTEYRFTGQREQASVGLYHMGARFYDVALGRWISADTIVPEPGNPQDLNRYSYVRGNPLKLSDPSGHLAEGEDNTGDVDLTLELLILGEGDLLLIVYGPDGLQRILERREIEQMLQEIGTTEYGSEFVQKVLKDGWTIKYGEPLAGAAFTYSWKVITVDREGAYQEKRGRLAHELVHAALYGGTWANSIRQEFVAEYYEKCISSQMAPVDLDTQPRVGSVPLPRWNDWFGENALSVAEHYQRIENYSDWHRDSLPQEQPTGLGAALWAIWQGITFWRAW
jgi:RHS repeat-associated protein